MLYKTLAEKNLRIITTGNVIENPQMNEDDEVYSSTSDEDG